MLVVDDETDILEVLCAVLEDQGYRTLSAANGREGLELLEDARPDLVVVDVMMPILDGPAMIREMRARPAHASTPVLIMSAAARRNIADELPGVTFLRKPFALENLLGLVDRLLDEGARAGAPSRAGS